jgi:NLR family CARD domain-containing protein 3
MADKKLQVLPLLTPYRMNSKKIKIEPLENMPNVIQKEDNLLFKSKSPLPKQSFIKCKSPKLTDSASIFFDSLKKNQLFSVRIPETQSMPYLTDCKKNFLNPIPIGLNKVSGSSVDVKNYSMGDNYAETFGKKLKSHLNLEKLNMNGNSLTPKGTKSILINIKNQPIKELSLNDNQTDHKAIKALIGLVIKPSPTLRYLDLENTRISDKEVFILCEALANDRMLNFLGLARNSLSPVSAKFIKNMVLENNYLKKLDLHWNSLKDTGALLIFEGLKSNVSLKELDISWNYIGRSSTQTIKSISDCLSVAEGLRHLDISFNYLTALECSILGQGLTNNHEILGIHILGNEAIIDSQGFVHSSPMIKTEESHLYKRLFHNKKPRKNLLSKCWLCENWVEIKFIFKNSDSKGPIFLHLDCDDYQPDMMSSIKGTYELERVVPPKQITFFFSQNNLPMRSNQYEIIELANSVEINVKYSETLEVKMHMHMLNAILAEGKPCDYDFPFSTMPRKAKFSYKPPSYKMIKIAWSIDSSLFKDYRFLNDSLISDCLDFDWKQSRLDLLIKSTEDQEALKKLLLKHYKGIIETFRYLSGQCGNEYFSIGSNIFTDFLNQGKLIDHLYEASDLGVNWNSAIVPKTKQPYNPGNALVRYEFMEMLVRVASDRYFRNKTCKSIPEAFESLMNDGMSSMLSLHNSNDWRLKSYICEEIDVTLKAYKLILDTVFRMYSGKKALPGQKHFMCIEEFRQLCYDSKIVNLSLPSREIDMCYCQAMMVQIDEMYEKKHIEMNFTEFLEAFSRVCNFIKISNFDEDKLENNSKTNNEPSLKAKIEIGMWKLIKLCPKNIRDTFVIPTSQIYSGLLYKLEKS